MKVLIVASGNSGKAVPFITDQAEALSKQGVFIEYFLIKGSGIIGYFGNYRALVKKIKQYKPDIVHAHYGLSGLLASLQRKVPVVTTFHGSDINVKKNRFFSKLAFYLSRESIFVSKDLAKILKIKSPVILPCGVDFDVFQLYDKKLEREYFNLQLDKKYILFSSAFNNKVKNYPLAKEALDMLNNVELLELKGYTRKQVAKLMNAVDAVIMTSFTEGSPQFIKEALACNCSIVTVNVGDVEELLKEKKGAFIADRTPQSLSQKLLEAFEMQSISNRDKVNYLDNKLIAKKIIDLYNKILEKNKK